MNRHLTNRIENDMMLVYVLGGMTLNDNEQTTEPATGRFHDEPVVLILVVLFGLGVVLISLGSILIAFYQWKLF